MKNIYHINLVKPVFAIIGCVLSILGTQSAQAAPDIALHMKYTVSPLPNYPLTASSSDDTLLTDGKYTSGHFWTKKTTVGWVNSGDVEITIDLAKECNIAGVAFNSAMGTIGQVNFPAHIYVFIGTDEDHYSFVGDLIPVADTYSTPYLVKKFVLEGLKARGRYVYLHIVPNGHFIFCDEIEVAEGSREYANKGSLSAAAVRTMSANFKKVDIERILLKKLIDELSANVGSAWLDRFSLLKRRLPVLATLDDCKLLENDILNVRRDFLRTRNPDAQLFIEAVGPWSRMSPVYIPHQAGSSLISISAPQNGYGYGAAVISNLTDSMLSLNCELMDAPAASPTIMIYRVPFITSAAMEFVPDPLMPINGAFVIKSGESIMLFVAARSTTAGNWKNSIRINAGGFQEIIPISFSVSPVSLASKFHLDAVNWAYLDSPMFDNRKAIAVQDLLRHHIDVVVVPPSQQPFIDSSRVPDFSAFESYLNYFKGMSKVMIFMGLNNTPRLTSRGRYLFLSDEWKKAYRFWFQGLTTAAAHAGFSNEQLYIYPFDEPQKDQIDELTALSRWIHADYPNTKLYSTLVNSASLAALPYLNIVQVQNGALLSDQHGNTSAEMWLYNTNGPAQKSSSPYSYFRLMAWTAFSQDLSGIGFWGYANIAGSAWDDFDGAYPDYAVVYDGPANTLISSRRWEAWRKGIEDYEVLKLFADKFGKTAALQMANQVLNNPGNTSLADERISEMMNRLTGGQ